MNLSQLRYFLVAAQFEHFGMAARALYITQPALSNSIARLEAELGVKLFEHTGRNVALSPDGKEFKAHVASALAELDLAIESVKSQHKDAVHTLHIGAVAALLRGFLSSIINTFNDTLEHRLEIDISQKGSTHECVAGLREGSLDVAFCGWPPHESGFLWVPLSPQNAVAAVNVNHPLAAQEKVSLSEIKEYPALSYREPSYMFYAFQEMFKAYGIEAKEAFEDEISALSVMAANEKHVGIMLDTVEDVVWSSVRLIPIEEFSKPYHWVGMLYKEKLPYPEEIKAFIRHVIEISSRLPYEEPIERQFYR